MKNILEEILYAEKSLTSDPIIRRTESCQCGGSSRKRHPRNCHCKNCRTRVESMNVVESELAFMIDQNMNQIETELSARQLKDAVEYNQDIADHIGWAEFIDDIKKLLRITSNSDEDFANALSKWQKPRLGEKKTDGMLGEETWKLMQKELGIIDISCEPGKFKKEIFEITPWNERIRTRKFPKDSGPMPIFTRGRIRLPFKRAQWLFQELKSNIQLKEVLPKNGIIHRLPSNASKILPYIDGTVELRYMKTNIPVPEITKDFHEFLLRRHKEELPPCSDKLFAFAYFPVTEYKKIQDKFLGGVSIDPLFSQAKVTLPPESHTKEDYRKLYLLVYVSFPNAVRPLIPEPSSPKKCGKFTPQTFESTKPREIQIVNHTTNQSCQLIVNSNFGKFAFFTGQVWKDHENKSRYIVAVSPFDVIYVDEKNSIWSQSPFGFYSDITMGNMSRRVTELVKPLKIILDVELHILRCIVVIHPKLRKAHKAVKKIGLIAVAAKIYANRDKWIETTKLFIKIIKILLKYAPNMSKLIFQSSLKYIIESSLKNLKIADILKALCEIIGFVFSKELPSITNLMTRSIVSAFKEVSTLIIKNAGKNVILDTKRASEVIYNSFKNNNIHISMNDAKIIVNEYIDSKQVLDAAIKDMINIIINFEDLTKDLAFD